MAGSAAPERPIQANVKQRCLYRCATEESVVWFPHDNHPGLRKALVWESGNPRWVLHGTPASGAGVMGCLETGVSVIARCEDTRHETNLSNPQKNLQTAGKPQVLMWQPGGVTQLTRR